MIGVLSLHRQRPRVRSIVETASDAIDVYRRFRGIAKFEDSRRRGGGGQGRTSSTGYPTSMKSSASRCAQRRSGILSINRWRSSWHCKVDLLSGRLAKGEMDLFRAWPALTLLAEYQLSAASSPWMRPVSCA